MSNDSPAVMAAPESIPDGVIATITVRVASDAVERLPHAEAELARSLSTARRAPFIAGRMALRAALHAVDPALAGEPLLRTARGGPLLPAGVSGSISHKPTRAIAIVAPFRDNHLGIDLEHRPIEGDPRNAETATGALARRILTAHELEQLDQFCAEKADHSGNTSGARAWHERALREYVLLHFALKEAVYKSIDPLVNRHVRFTEVQLDVRTQSQPGELSSHAQSEGTASVTLLLPELSGGSVEVNTAWWMDEDWIVATSLCAQ